MLTAYSTTEDNTMNKLRVLIACEESQAVCIAFRERGHEAYSCDIQPCSGGHPEWHIQDDALKTLWRNIWDLVIAHPPCTRLANSGVRWLHERGLWHELKEAILFFTEFQKYAKQGHKIAIENTVPHKYAVNGFRIDEYIQGPPEQIFGIGDYTQLIQPWQFGHGEQKATCLWLYGVPNLLPTNIVQGREQRIFYVGPSKNRSKIRSKTFPGIARAMAAQWGAIDNTITPTQK